jgi:hypothetical protein
MRVDYFHTGDAKQELFSFHRAVIEPCTVARRPDQRETTTNLGKYFFEVRDQKTQRVLYSRGFASVYGEWETTDEAQKIKRSFSESFPFSGARRGRRDCPEEGDAKNDWVKSGKLSVDPRHFHRSINRAPRAADSNSENGRPGDEVDLLLLGDGYTAREISSRLTRAA